MAQTSPFEGHSKLYLLYGHTDDEFCLASLSQLSLEEYLVFHLKEIGFESVIFFSPIKKIYFRDALTLANYRAASGVAEPETAPVSRIAPGPMGTVTIRDRPKAEISRAAGTVRPRRPEWRLSVPDADLPTTVGTILESTQKRTAFIFTQYEDVVTGFSSSTQRQLSNSIEAFLKDRREDNTNICVFISGQDVVSPPRNPGTDMHDFHNRFSKSFFNKDGSPKDGLVCVGSPRQDEYENYINRLRLKDGVPINLSYLETYAAGFSVRAASEGQNFSDTRRLVRATDMNRSMTTQTGLEALEDLVGRQNISRTISRTITYAKQQKNTEASVSRGRTGILKTVLDRLTVSSLSVQGGDYNLSLGLAGNTGTGKTMIARLIGKAYKDAGILTSGHMVESSLVDFVSGYVGGTAIKTQQLLERAYGGVLFIDEVQNFSQDNDFHAEAIRTVMKYMYDNRDNIAVIVATYPNQMDTFLDSDEGLRNRFSNILTLEDYSGEEMCLIAEKMANRKGLTFSNELNPVLLTLFENWASDRSVSDFANGRSVETLLREMQQEAVSGHGYEKMITTDHIPQRFKKYSNTSNAPEKTAAAELGELIGLSGVKSAVRRYENTAKLSRRQGKSVQPGHFLFTGGPGTGKTTVARLLGRIMKELGLLKSGHIVEVSRQDLVGGYQGQTAINVKEKVNDALDGVLFVDEAHNLVSGETDSYGKEALKTLVNLIENNRGRLSVILAGYPTDIEKLLRHDSGLKSRFTNQIVFEDFDKHECAEIFHFFTEKHERKLSVDLKDMLSEVMDNLIKSEGADYSNARSVRNLIADIEGNFCMRLDESGVIDDRDADDAALTTYLKEDVPASLLPGEESGHKKQSARERLEAMIGLDDVKRLIAEYADQVEIRKSLDEPGINPGHFVFTGNPGTGKTEVARLFGEILKDLDLLKRGHVEEVSRQNLVAGYVGQTAIRTEAAVERALDGVLFVDEAHNLRSQSDNDFGDEAVKTMVNMIENNRTRLSVIFAGYEADIAQLIATDVGLSSRFTNYIHFPDYTASECAKIFRFFAIHKNRKIDPELSERLSEIMSAMIAGLGASFSNARSVRNVVDSVERNLFKRIKQKGLLEQVRECPALKPSLRTYRLEDIPVELRSGKQDDE